jgi:hypothetical protein
MTTIAIPIISHLIHDFFFGPEAELSGAAGPCNTVAGYSCTGTDVRKVSVTSPIVIVSPVEE